jgi:AcrR family transcriptional regulator
MNKSRRAAPAPKRSYHHGDLRRALVEAGLAIVETRGSAALSLRAVARRARVSHAAPYHHFRTKAGLLAAVAAAGFDRFVATIQAEVARQAPRTPLDQLRVIGSSYVGFAARNPLVFRLMFRPELTRPSEHPVLLEAEGRAYGVLHYTLAAAQAQGQLPPGDLGPYAALAWSTTHGLAMLHIEQVLAETPLGHVDFERLADAVNELCVAGIEAVASCQRQRAAK